MKKEFLFAPASRWGGCRLVKWASLSAGLALAVASLGGCRQARPGDSDEKTVRIAVVVDASDQESARRRLAMLQLAAEEINEAGGLLIDGENWSIAATAALYENTPEGRAKTLDDMVEQGVSFGVGPNTSSAVLGQLSDHSDGFAIGAQARDIILVSPSATSSAISSLDSGGHQWRVVPPDDLQAKLGATHLLERGIATLSVIYLDDSYGVDLTAKMVAEFEAGGGTVLAQVPVELSVSETYDYAEELEQAMRGMPEAIYLVASELGPIGNNLILKGYWEAYGDNPPILFASDAAITFDLLSNALPEVLDALSGTAPASDPTSADFLAFQRVLERFDTEVLAYDAYRWDAFYVLAYAIQKAQSVDADRVRQELVNVTGPDDGDLPVHVGEWTLARAALLEGRDIDYEGASGPISLKTNGDPADALYALWTVEQQDDGSYAYDFTNVVRVAD